MTSLLTFATKRSPFTYQEKKELSLDFASQKFSKDDAGLYHLHCHNETKGMEATLQFTPQRKVIRQGENGLVKIGLDTDTMFYYYIPRCGVTGTIKVDGKEYTVAGNGWYDHEFGGDKAKAQAADGTNKKMHAEKTEAEKDYAWNWISLQLDDGTDITATRLVQPSTGNVEDEYAIVTLADSSRKYYKGITFKPLNNWVSVRTTQQFPTEWQLDIPDAKISLKASAAFQNQVRSRLLFRRRHRHLLRHSHRRFARTHSITLVSGNHYYMQCLLALVPNTHPVFLLLFIF
jgi:predicted secreted hydrolase